LGCSTARTTGASDRLGELEMNVTTILKQKGSEVITTAPSATVMDVARVMADKRIGAVLVLDKGWVVGVVSERDIVRIIATKGAAALYLEVKQLMTSDVFSCERTATVDEVMGIMTERRIRHIPIIEDGQLYGLVSIGDVVKQRIEETEKEAEALRGYIHAS
jgi:CBS domain-containing protein